VRRSGVRFCLPDPLRLKAALQGRSLKAKRFRWRRPVVIRDRELEFSPLGGHVTRHGITVEVHIHRSADTEDEWTLEVVGPAGRHTVWEQTFADDQEALQAFERAVAVDGMRPFIEGTVLHCASSRQWSRRSTP
jgi:hypothetical protein